MENKNSTEKANLAEFKTSIPQSKLKDVPITTGARVKSVIIGIIMIAIGFSLTANILLPFLATLLNLSQFLPYLSNYGITSSISLLGTAIIIGAVCDLIKAFLSQIKAIRRITDLFAIVPNIIMILVINSLASLATIGQQFNLPFLGIVALLLQIWVYVLIVLVVIKFIKLLRASKTEKQQIITIEATQQLKELVKQAEAITNLYEARNIFEKAIQFADENVSVINSSDINSAKKAQARVNTKIDELTKKTTAMIEYTRQQCASHQFEALADQLNRLNADIQVAGMIDLLDQTARMKADCEIEQEKWKIVEQKLNEERQKRMEEERQKLASQKEVQVLISKPRVVPSFDVTPRGILTKFRKIIMLTDEITLDRLGRSLHLLANELDSYLNSWKTMLPFEIRENLLIVLEESNFFNSVDQLINSLS